jgi:PDZ domain-containing protein
MPDAQSMERRVLLSAIGVVLVLVFAAYVLYHQSDTFVLLPDHPHPAAAIVDVQGEAPDGDTSGPGIYYLDVLVHRATIAEAWLAPLESDAERLPADEVIPPAGTQQDLQRVDLLDVAGSKRLAALVALRALGRKVVVTGGGARIDAVEPTAPAHAAGLAAGMVVTGVDGGRIGSLADLKTALAKHKAGQTVTLAVLDGTHRRTLHVRLISDSAVPGRALLGIEGEDEAPTVKLPIKVRIDTGDLGGPSAGLAFTLEIYDSLTGRKLAHGRFIAATGTIDEHGDVGLVGGIKGKTIGARKNGFDVMLVPKQEAKTARRYAGSHLRVIGVKTFAGALAALRAPAAQAGSN